MRTYQLLPLGIDLCPSLLRFYAEVQAKIPTMALMAVLGPLVWVTALLAQRLQVTTISLQMRLLKLTKATQIILTQVLSLPRLWVTMIPLISILSFLKTLVCVFTPLTLLREGRTTISTIV